MLTVIAVLQNHLLSILDFIFNRIVILFRSMLFKLLYPLLKKNEIRIDERLRIKQANPQKANDGLSLLKLTSTTNSLGVVANNSFEYFFFPIPNLYKSQLNEYKFYVNGECNKNSKYYSRLITFLTENYSILKDDADELISRQIYTVAQLFLDEVKAGRQKSNNKMFGVDRIVERGNHIELQLFVTDYFTYTCINRIYRYLREFYSQNLSLQVKSIDDVNKLCPFLCNFGVGGFLSLNYADKEVYFIGKRSSSVACPNVWQTSFDETFDLRDKPNLQGASPNLRTCLERGVKEELGFLVFEHKFRLESSLLSVIQTNERFEIELFIIGHCIIKNTKEFEDVILQMYSAPDFENENEIIQLVPQEDVSSFYEQLKSKGESHTIEASELWATFMKIRNMRNPFVKFVGSLEL